MAPAALRLVLGLAALSCACASPADAAAAAATATVPPYVKQCREDDPHLTQCFIAALHHVRPFIAKGIPEIELPPVEPFRLEELSLALSSGPGGYRVTLRDLDIFGASNFSVQRLSLGGAGKPFEARILIPQLAIDAKYSSSGVLIILPASGNGTFHATLGDVTALLRGRAVVEEREGDDGASGRFLRVQSLALDLAIKTVRMRVRKAFNNNRILTEATNLFLRENGHEVVKAMMPQLRGKLADVFQQIANGLLAHVPIDLILLPASDPAPAA